MDDNDIIERIKKGEQDAYALLVEKYHRQLLSFIYNIVRTPSMVEDIGQEVFLNVYISLERFDTEAGAPFSAWLFITARNRAISFLRKKNKWKTESIENSLHTMASSNVSADEMFIDKERRQSLHQCLAQLEEPYRTTIIDSLAGKTIQEMAQLHTTQPGTIKSRLHRAKKQLFVLMNKLYPQGT